MNAHGRIPTLHVASLVAPFVALVCVTAAAPPAHAGSYLARFCDDQVPGAGEALGFERAGALPKFNMFNYCGPDGEFPGGGLRVEVAPSAAAQEQFGAWLINKPSGVAIEGVSFKARGSGADARTPRVVAWGPTGAFEIVVGAQALPPEFGQQFSRPGDLAAFGVQLYCNAQSGNCPDVTTSAAYAAIKDLTFTVIDGNLPTLELTGGALFSGPIQRDTQDVAFTATDAGSGVHEVTIRVNGEQLPPLIGACYLGAGFATRLAACDPTLSGAISLNTRSTPFHPGANRVVVCARDYATASANQVCAPKQIVQVENGCPVNTGAPADQGSQLTLGFGRERTSLTVRQGDRPRAAAVLRGADGSAIGGAQVCIWSRQKGKTTEKLLSQGVTNSGGAAAVQLPKGPSRILRASYWYGDAEHVLSATARVKVRPEVGLRLRPKGKLSNGDRLRLRAALDGPFSKGRKVCFFVRQPRKDFRLGCDQTNDRGVAGERHKFREVSGSAKFSFYAAVPKQRGYPYTKGRSKVKTTRVTG